MKKTILLLFLLLATHSLLPAQGRSYWHTATPDELSAFLPDRAVVGKERIESDLRTASGIVNERGQLIASVLLITAGYAADGKFSYYLLTQHTLHLGDVKLSPGAYVIGWTRTEGGLDVRIFNAASITSVGSVVARPNPESRHVVSFHIWPPESGSFIQIGRYVLPYRPE